MTDKKNIAVVMHLKAGHDFAHYPRLSRAGGFPVSDTLVWGGKELICDSFKLIRA